MDNTKRIVSTVYGSTNSNGSDDNAAENRKEYVHEYEGFLRRIGEVAKQALEDHLKTRKKEFRDFINHKGRRGCV